MSRGSRKFGRCCSSLGLGVLSVFLLSLGGSSLGDTGTVSIVMLDTPKSIVAAESVFGLSADGDGQRRSRLTPKPGYTFLRVAVDLEFPAPGIFLEDEIFQIRTPAGEVLRPIDILTSFRTDFSGGYSVKGGTPESQHTKTVKGLVFVVPSDGIDELEVFVKGIRAGTRPEFRSRLRAAQAALAKLGFDPGSADGLWGPKTSAAIEAYQSTAGIRPTGRLDLLTAALLKE